MLKFEDKNDQGNLCIRDGIVSSVVIGVLSLSEGCGEYRLHAHDVMSADELRQIADKLDELNAKGGG